MNRNVYREGFREQRRAMPQMKDQFVRTRRLDRSDVLKQRTRVLGYFLRQRTAHHFCCDRGAVVKECAGFQEKTPGQSILRLAPGTSKPRSGMAIGGDDDQS